MIGCDCDHCRVKRITRAEIEARLLVPDDPTPVLSPGTIADDAAIGAYNTWNDDQKALIYEALRRDRWDDNRAANQRHKARCR